ncbi:acid phosphatase [Thermaurantiacus sp.]
MRAATVLLLFLAGCVGAPALEVAPPPTSVAAIGELRPGILNGYLGPSRLPDSAALMPPPPAAASAAQAADEAGIDAALQASPARFEQARQDALLGFPDVTKSFTAILGVTLDERATPHSAMLFRRALTDAGLSTYAAKQRHQRTRPFVARSLSTCTPEDEAFLRTDGSYPSGHAAIGWMLALLSVELAPDRQDALLQRGFDFGESRIVCRVHWPSDVAAGRVMASATFARLQADPVFRAQRDLARAEIARARAQVAAAGPGAPVSGGE